MAHVAAIPALADLGIHRVHARGMNPHQNLVRFRLGNGKCVILHDFWAAEGMDTDGVHVHGGSGGETVFDGNAS
jgi:hypothetical protein